MRNKLHLPLNYSYDIAKSSWEIDRPHQFKTDRAPTDDQQTCFKNKVTSYRSVIFPEKKIIISPDRRLSVMAFISSLY